MQGASEIKQAPLKIEEVFLFKSVSQSPTVTTCSLSAFVALLHVELGFGGGGEDVREGLMAHFLRVTYFSY